MRLPEIGDSFEAKYTIEQLLGEGGFGLVYQAVRIGTNRPVAIKVLKPGDAGYEVKRAARFMRELSAISKLSSQHVVTLYDYGKTSEGLLYMVCELVPGQDLSELLVHRGRLSEPETIHIVAQVLEGLSEAHGLGLLHRDLKPPNIRVFEYFDDPLSVKVLDFGLAKSLSPAEIALTATGRAIGTPRYMAPEQLFGEPLSPGTDIYSLGLVALECLRGRDAWHPTDVAQGRRPHLLSGDGVSPGLSAIINRMLELDPQKRFGSAAEVLSALRELALAGRTDAPTLVRPGPAPRLGSVPEADADTSRRLLVAGLLGVFVVAVAVSLGDRSPETPPPRLPVGPPAANTLLRTAQPVAASPDSSFTKDQTTVERRAGTNDSPGCGYERRGGTMEEHRVDLIPPIWSRFQLYLPRGYDKDAAHPVVVLVHDEHQEPGDLLQHGGFKELADEHGLILLAPRFTRTTSPFPWRYEGDIASIRNAFREARDNYCVDMSRVFVVGHRYGGVATNWLRCEPWVTAVSVFGKVETQRDDLCVESTPKPLMIVQSMQNPEAPIQGGRNCHGHVGILSAEQQEQRWITRNGCAPESTEIKVGASSCTIWDCEAALRVCQVDGGHQWPGVARPTPPSEDCDGPTTSVELAPLMWDFFATIEAG